ncbi:MAG: trypsin-like serine protease [Ruminococcaceae bacterium]|nr:trypsin-like serine protease [Oscillospiraceae bacterium]
MKTKICSVVLSVCLLFGCLGALSSCDKGGNADLVNAEINENGELVLTFGDGTEKNLGVVVGKDGKDGADGANGENGQNGASGGDGYIHITTDESAISLATAKGLRSAVSIVANFEATVQQGGWYPGYGSTTTEEYSFKGSGVIYRMDKNTGDAFVITNYHVVYDESSNSESGISEDIEVYLYGSEIEEKTIKATYVGGSMYYDIAVLHIENSDILKDSDACATDISDSDTVSVGDSAIAIGNAKGYGISASLGIVSVDSEHLTMLAVDGKTAVSFRVMRVDTAINSGNSGGGLYDENGTLIGIVNAKIIDDGVENIGYAIPSNVAVAITENIIDHCYGKDETSVQRAMLGLTVTSSDSRALYDPQSGKITLKETVSVYEVAADSLASGVLQKEDVLVSITLDGKTTQITRQHQIIERMLDARVGDTVTIALIRGGTNMTIDITITQDSVASY